MTCWRGNISTWHRGKWPPHHQRWHLRVILKLQDVSKCVLGVISQSLLHWQLFLVISLDSHILMNSTHIEEQIFFVLNFRQGQTNTLGKTQQDQNTHAKKRRRRKKKKHSAAAADLLVESGVRRPLVDEQFDDVFVAFPCSQVKRVAALVVGDVGQGLVS